MRIEYVNGKPEEQLTFDTAEPGTVAQFKDEDGPLILKLDDGKATLLCYSNGLEAFLGSDGTIEKDNSCKILGKLVGIIIE